MKERFRERLPLIRPLLVPFILYMGLLVFVITFMHAYPTSAWRYPVALTPMLPGFFLAAGLVRAIRHLDEMNRKIIFESLAVAFAATLFLTLSLGLLGFAGLGNLDSIYIALFMVVVAFIAKLVISRRYE